ncbi:hypothetical protein EDD22DRAFT_970762 [Suillus occidentalis]|nr:hypothetical protein EDD22DRAFT_970762 [Suillus occidentalis]
MSGYNIGGSSITVTPAANNKTSSPSTGKNSDARRNLYVLGLPFDLTKCPNFPPCFRVLALSCTAVILATVDNASRRRGFVVMSSHEEAKRAMNALSRTQMKGHTLDVSWAVVQRSQGFLDGADRTMMLASSNPSSLPEMEFDHQPAPPTIRFTKTRLQGMEYPIGTFLEVASDLHPLFYPFGPIKEVKLMDCAMLGNGTTTALVEYVNVFDAQEAKDALQRQFYGTSRLEVRFIQDNIHPVNSTAAAYAQSPMLPKTSDAGLNPCAAPFVFGSRHLPPLASGHSAVAHHSFVNDFYSLPDFPSDTFQAASFAPHPVAYRLKAHVADPISRSSSATSSSWSNDTRPYRSSRAPFSSFTRANTPAQFTPLFYA